MQTCILRGLGLWKQFVKAVYEGIRATKMFSLFGNPCDWHQISGRYWEEQDEKKGTDYFRVNKKKEVRRNFRYRIREKPYAHWKCRAIIQKWCRVKVQNKRSRGAFVHLLDEPNTWENTSLFPFPTSVEGGRSWDSLGSCLSFSLV